MTLLISSQFWSSGVTVRILTVDAVFAHTAAGYFPTLLWIRLSTKVLTGHNKVTKAILQISLSKLYAQIRFILFTQNI